MRHLQLLPAFIVAIAATISATTDPIPSAPPRFETLFFGTLDIGEGEMLQGPFGTRVNIPVMGFNLTDPCGDMVATLASPTADTGIISSSGLFFPEAVIALRWEVDHKLALLTVNGVGQLFKSDLVYIHLETDSETYSSLNGRFLVGNVSFPKGEHSRPIFTIFGAL